MNFLWAFLYNVMLIPIAMGFFWHYGVHLNPAFASIAMAMSSISVVLSSLILKLYGVKTSLHGYIKYNQNFDTKSENFRLSNERKKENYNIDLA